MSDQPDQPQLTAGDQLELELRTRLVDLETRLTALGGAVLGLAIACAAILIIIRRKTSQ